MCCESFEEELNTQFVSAEEPVEELVAVEEEEGKEGPLVKAARVSAADRCELWVMIRY
jgi:hypothetical protein